ncbi:MAG: CPBP family intramembrane glutamic endopeptidase [Planctomycetota bacterium]
MRLILLSAFTLYSGILFVIPGSWCPERLRDLWRRPRHWAGEQIEASWIQFGIPEPGINLINGTYFVLTAALIPLVILAIARRGYRPTSLARQRHGSGQASSLWVTLLNDLGLRKPNRLCLRFLVIAVLVVTPLLWWMVRAPGVAEGYFNWVSKHGWASVAAYYVVVLFVEHLFFHGVILSLASPGGVFPTPEPLVASGRGSVGRVLAWLGLGQTDTTPGEAGKVYPWLGLPRGCAFAILLAGILFGMAHAGKNPRELLLSFPGGILCGFLAIRANSWLVPWLIHLGIGGSATLMMLVPR